MENKYLTGLNSKGFTQEIVTWCSWNEEDGNAEKPTHVGIF